ncbi:ribonuclease H family protein [Bacillus altitudinis]|uniref:ribonuclease H family protein n=1 Tax=Bacillus altitudinis TaxID=293387 RepID=UPI00223692D0|nr:ribonuclease H family protein [Bacillus altitudinis]MCW4359527.1 ribonuclease H family protein [Bacillus altitudinis]
MAKFYAVKRGRREGIYTSWDECKKQVNGFTNALYKSFPTYEEAKSFIGTDGTSGSSERIGVEQISDITAYIDGSYDDRKKLYSYAGIVFLKNSERIEFFYADSDSELIDLRNVAGEIKAAMHVIDLALNEGAKSIDIYYDYAGIENWANKSWKAKNFFTQKYVEYIEAVKSKIDIYFKKVKSHSGNKYNDEVDLLAKKAIDNYEVTNKTATSLIGEYAGIFDGLSATKKSVNLNFITENEIYDSDKIYGIFKEKWKSSGRKLKDINEFKTLVDIEGRQILFKVNTGSNEEVFKFNLKEFK